MTRLGIIPAGGKAQRFNKTYKEMLPCSNEFTLLGRCVSTMLAGQVDEITILTTPEKISMHANALARYPFMSFRLSEDSLWASLVNTLSLPYDEFLFAMPDTYYPGNCFVNPTTTEFTIGVFQTLTPSRFGVLHEDCIWDKHFESGEYKAWGMLIWSRKVAEFWRDRDRDYDNHTVAFNAAMKEFGYSTFDLAYYYDMASFADYRKLVQDVF